MAATIEKPFLLDPDYEKLLESSAYRQRVYEKIGSRNMGSMIPLFFVMQIPTIVTGVLGLTVDRATFIATAIWGGAVTVMFGIFALFWLLDRPRRMRMYRLAWEGNMVTGELLTCARKCYSGDIYKVEVQYSARAPGGKPIAGTQALERDDLLNDRLPAPGTPVLVLVVDETLFFML